VPTRHYVMEQAEEGGGGEGGALVQVVNASMCVCVCVCFLKKQRQYVMYWYAAQFGYLSNHETDVEIQHINIYQTTSFPHGTAALSREPCSVQTLVKSYCGAFGRLGMPTVVADAGGRCSEKADANFRTHVLRRIY